MFTIFVWILELWWKIKGTHKGKENLEEVDYFEWYFMFGSALSFWFFMFIWFSI